MQAKINLCCIIIGCSLIGIAAAKEISDQGRELAFARNKGNCLACHVIAGGSQMGDIGPALFDINIRFPDRRRLRDQIWDASEFNPVSLMPPFGRHKILSDSEIDAIVEYLYTL